MLSRPRGLAAIAAWAWLLAPLQLARALRSGDRAGLVQAPEGASPELARIPPEPIAPAHPEDPRKTAVAKALNADFERDFGGRVDEAFAGLEYPAVLTVSGFIERLLVNFLLNLQGAAKRSRTDIRVANALLDTTSLETCRRLAGHSRVQRLKLLCIDLVGLLPLEGGGRPKGGSFLWAKPVVFRRAVAASRYGVLMADIDVVFYQDLLPWVKRHWTENPDVVLTTGTEWGTCCNTGTVYAEKRSLPVLDMWVEANHRWYQRHLGDQDALLELIVFNVATALNISNNFKLPYPQDAFDKDKTYKYRISLFDEAVVVQQGRKCRGCEGCRGPCKSGKAPYANHYNAIQMHMQPEHFLDSRGNWSDLVDTLATGTLETRQKMMIQGGDWCALDELEGMFAVPEEGAGSTASSARGGIYNRDAGGVYHRTAGGVYHRDAGRGLQR